MAIISFPSSWDSDRTASRPPPPTGSLIVCLLTAASLWGSGPVYGQDSAVVIGSFDDAAAVSVDPAGNIYVADAGANRVLKLSRSGGILASVGGYGWTEQALDGPRDVFAPNGLDVYVADERNHRIQHFDRNLSYVSTLSTRHFPEGGGAFGYPKSMAVSRQGSIYVVDGENRRVVRFGPGDVPPAAFGGLQSGRGTLHMPGKVRLNDGDTVYVEDGGGIILYDAFGNYLAGTGENTLRGLRTFALAGRRVFVADSCRLSVLADEIAPPGVPEMLPCPPNVGYCGITDLDIRNDTLYVLYPHTLALIPLASIGGKEGGEN